MTDQHSLAAYLNNHLAGATAGLELFRRAARDHTLAEHARELEALAAEVEADRESLRKQMRHLDIPENRAMAGIGWLGEKAGRLKPNGYLVGRSPLADLAELEGLRIAVTGKLAGWQVLRAVAVHDSRLDKTELETLIERAEDQAHRLYKLHLRVAEERLVVLPA